MDMLGGQAHTELHGVDAPGQVLPGPETYLPHQLGPDMQMGGVVPPAYGQGPATTFAVPGHGTRVTWSDELGNPLAEVFYSAHLHYSSEWRMDEAEHGSVCCTVM